MKQYLHLGMNPKRGRKIGVPAQTIVNMFTDIVLNLTAAYDMYYLIFLRCRDKLEFNTQKGRIQQRNMKI